MLKQNANARYRITVSEKYRKSRFEIDQSRATWQMDQFCVPFYIFLRCVELYEIEEANQKRAPNSKTILGGCRLVIPRGLFTNNCHFIWHQQFFVFFKRLEYLSWRIKLETFLNLETFFRLRFFANFLRTWNFRQTKFE